MKTSTNVRQSGYLNKRRSAALLALVAGISLFVIVAPNDGPAIYKTVCWWVAPVFLLLGVAIGLFLAPAFSETEQP